MVSEREMIILVHGLYLRGWCMQPLAKRLRRAGYDTLLFSYPSVRRAPLDNARALAEVVQTLTTVVVHFVAHSLGGIVVRHLFERFPSLPPGRVVTLGTPHRGSHTAHTLRTRGFGCVLGRSIEQGLLDESPPWPAGWELGSLAGTLNIGLGRLVGDMPGPADGTVAVAETRLAGMADHICLPVSHTGMLLAPTVAAQVCAFLATGHFQRPLDSEWGWQCD